MPLPAFRMLITIPTEAYERELLEISELQKGKKNNISTGDNASVSNEFGNGTSFENIVGDCVNELKLPDVVWLRSKNEKYFQIYFTTNAHDNAATLQYLVARGVGGGRHSSVGYFPFGLLYCNEDVNGQHSQHIFSNREDNMMAFLKSITSRLTFAEVVEGVRNSATITFDFILYTLIAGCIACAGLMNNSPQDIASAMMIEPVMSTVLAMSFGAVIHDRILLKLGFRNCCISLILCLLIGFVYGGIAMIWARHWNPPAVESIPSGVWPTHEMQRHGLWRTLWYGALQALAAGGAVSITLLNDNQAALVGVAVCSTHLPPFINAGALWAYAAHLENIGLKQHWISVIDHVTGITHRMKPSWVPIHGYHYVYSFDMRYESFALGGVSMLLTLVDVVCLGFAAIAVLKLKEIVPVGKREENCNFFKENITFTRFNRKSSASTNLETGKQMEEINAFN